MSGRHFDGFKVGMGVAGVEVDPPQAEGRVFLSMISRYLRLYKDIIFENRTCNPLKRLGLQLFDLPCPHPYEKIVQRTVHKETVAERIDRPTPSDGSADYPFRSLLVLDTFVLRMSNPQPHR